jgi:conjugative transposon TraM protein
LRLLDAQAQEQARIKNLQDLNNRIAQSAKKGESMSSDDYVVPMTDEERAKALAMRRQGMMAELDRDLNNVRAQGAAAIGAVADAQDSIISKGAKAARDVADEAPNAVRELDDDAQNNIVTKVSKDESEYFNTLSENAPNSNLIRAIIDEEVKAVEGSRVRLRLLDAIDINGTQLPKGSYLYATMSGFGQQRVKGKVQSVLVGDEILKIGLSIYDVTDGQEGLYVPASQFRETAKDIGSTAMQGNMNLNQTSGGTSVSQWAGQALQNAYQKTSNAISKAIKKNRVRLKYGTQVFLVNSKQQRKR